MTIPNIGIRPISGALGAEIEGIDLAEPMSEQTFSAQSVDHTPTAIRFRSPLWAD